MLKKLFYLCLILVNVFANAQNNVSHKRNVTGVAENFDTQRNNRLDFNCLKFELVDQVNEDNIVKGARVEWEILETIPSYIVMVKAKNNQSEVIREVVTGASFSFQDKLKNGETYYVSVMPNDSYAYKEDCNQLQFLYEKQVIKKCLQITYPALASDVAAEGLVFKWDEALGALSYEVVLTESSTGDEVYRDVVEESVYYMPVTLDYSTEYCFSVVVKSHEYIGKLNTDYLECEKTCFTTMGQTDDYDTFVNNNKDLGFSPNGDGINDVLYIKGIEQYPDNKFVLYNRNGVRVFEIKKYNNKDRVFKGGANVGVFKSLSPDVYYFTLEINNVKNHRGFVLIKK